MKRRTRKANARAQRRIAKENDQANPGGKSRYAKKAAFCLSRGVHAFEVVDKSGAWGGSNDQPRTAWWLRNATTSERNVLFNQKRGTRRGGRRRGRRGGQRWAA